MASVGPAQPGPRADECEVGRAYIALYYIGIDLLCALEQQTLASQYYTQQKQVVGLF